MSAAQFENNQDSVALPEEEEEPPKMKVSVGSNPRKY